MPEASFDCLSININIHINLSASSLSFFLSCCLHIPFPSQLTHPLPLLVSYLLPYLQATSELSDEDESHDAVCVFFLFIIKWHGGSLSWVPFCPHWVLQSSCLGAAAAAFSPAAWLAPPQPPCQHPWWSLADMQSNLLGAVRPSYIKPLTSPPCYLLMSWWGLHVLLWGTVCLL